jgi:hypothetical protein
MVIYNHHIKHYIAINKQQAVRLLFTKAACQRALGANMATKKTIEQRTLSTDETEAERRQTYRSPEIADLGKASELLQGGASVGRDNSNQTQW